MGKKRITNICIKVALSVLVCGVLIPISFTAKADNNDHINAYKPANKNINYAKKPKLKRKSFNYPSKYRSDDQAWSKDIKVKNQEKTGLCWAFASTTAAEYSYAKESYETLGSIKEISPGHLGNFLFNRTNDPLGNTEGDGLVVKSGQPAWPFVGGDPMYAAQHMATYSGAGLEENTPFENINDCIDDNYRFDVIKWRQYKSVWAPYEYQDYLTLQNSIHYILTGNGGKDTLKELIMEYGAAEVGIDMDIIDLYNDENNTYYNYSDYNNYNHGVTVIGWDDDFPKEKFAQDGEHPIPEPDDDGAWIIQNSWGEEFGEKGFFYVSYDSYGFTTENTADSFDMQPVDAYHYNFQYDGTSDIADTSEIRNQKYYTSKGTSVSNVFENTTGETISLDAVGITTYNEGLSTYKIQIYTDILDPADPTSGNLAETTVATTKTAGFKTLELASSVPIAANENYSIVIAFEEDNDFGVEFSRESMNNSVKYNAATSPGQSFFSKKDSNEWTDINDYKMCFRVKGFANSLTDPSTWKKITPKIELSNTSFVYNGKEQKPKVVVKDGERVLNESFYDISFNKKSVDVGEYSVTVTLKNGYSGTGTANYKINKETNTSRFSVKKVKIKKSKIRKKKQTIALKKWLVITNVKGVITFKRISAKKGKKSFSKKIKINGKTGKITLRKGLKKGTYKIKVLINVTGDNNYNSIQNAVTVKVRIK